MWAFIGFVVLIAIIFGVTLHDAFWGIVTFIIGFIIVCIAINALDAGISWLSKPATPKKGSNKKK